MRRRKEAHLSGASLRSRLVKLRGISLSCEVDIAPGDQPRSVHITWKGLARVRFAGLAASRQHSQVELAGCSLFTSLARHSRIARLGMAPQVRLLR